jgi:site-specific DNA recombinase
MKFFLYARKSTDDEERQMLSIEAQLTELREYASSEGLTVVREFVESRTAKEPGRPIFNDMLRRVEEGEASGLLAWHPDRLARNSVDGGQIVYLLDREKLVALRFPSFWFEDSPQGKFVLSIAFSQSKYYSDALSVNVRRGMRQKLRRGEYPGRPPVGYLNEPRARTIIADPHKAKLVRQMFEAYSTGRYTFDALKELTDTWGLTSHREKPLSRSMLPRLLVNPFYIGLFKFGGETHEGAHPPIVSKALFDEVQNVMARRGHPHKPRREPLPYLGFIQCGECGAAITGERQKGHHYYRCTRKLGPCSQKRFIREEALTDELRANTSRVAMPAAPGARMLAQIEKWRQTESDCQAEQLAAEKARLGKAETRISRLLDVYIDGSIEQADYTHKKKELLLEKTGVKERIRRIEKEGSAWLEPMETFLKNAILARTTALLGTEQELRDFHRRIGSNLSLIEPTRPKNAAQRRTQASKERAHPQAQESPATSSRRGGFAARDSIQPDSDSPRPPMRNSGPSSAESSAEKSKITSPAVTSNACQAESMAADTSAASRKSLSRVTESHDSASPEITGKKSSSRWADRPVPVLQVEFPEPWSIIARAASADAESADFGKNPEWSRLASMIRTWFINQSAAG